MIWLSRIIELLVVPPAGSLIVLIAGFALLRRRPRLSRALLVLGLVSLYLASTPLVGHGLIRLLEVKPLHAPETVEPQPEAIVVLGGPDEHLSGVEFGALVSGPHEMMRLRYGAHLHRVTGAPVLLVGGDPLNEGKGGAEVMATSLRELGVEPRWLDARSNNTFDNARYAREVLEAEGIDRVYVVTHAWHMPRAQAAFEAEGFDVVAAPTGFIRSGPLSSGLAALIPTPSALVKTRLAVHEIVGRVVYAVFY